MQRTPLLIGEYILSNTSFKFTATMMMHSLIMLALGGIFGIVYGKVTIPEGYYIERTQYYMSSITVQSDDTLSAQLIRDGFTVDLSNIPYNVDERTGMIDLEPDMFCNDADEFPFVFHLWKLKYDLGNPYELQFLIPGTEDYVPFQQSRRLLWNRNKKTSTTPAPITFLPSSSSPTTRASTIPVTSMTSPTTAGLTTTTTPPVPALHGPFCYIPEPTEQISFFDFSLDSFDARLVSNGIRIRIYSMWYKAGDISDDRVRNITVPFPSPLEFPYIDYKFDVEFDTKSDSVEVISEEGHHRMSFDARKC